MRELGIVAAITALMCLLSGVWFTPWETLYYYGIWVTVAGFIVGVPTGFVYHVRLYRTLNPRGELYTASTIKARLNMRDFMDTLRSSGVDTGGPASFSQADRQAFANQLDRLLAR